MTDTRTLYYTEAGDKLHIRTDCEHLPAPASVKQTVSHESRGRGSTKAVRDRSGICRGCQAAALRTDD